jgi:hypothetical protein
MLNLSAQRTKTASQQSRRLENVSATMGFYRETHAIKVVIDC